ncbi:MAG: hypothetical protein BWY36_00616 [Candidatus Diapherotrites archaeon ADurb.Bin253]|nr:MAG: hypothetical protein BWY36_00616 [Candidatus Diapherotrites archaeon ADurb.Bin253]
MKTTNKCLVCKKVLRSCNKSGLCSNCYNKVYANNLKNKNTNSKKGLDVGNDNRHLEQTSNKFQVADLNLKKSLCSIRGKGLN